MCILHSVYAISKHLNNYSAYTDSTDKILKNKKKKQILISKTKNWIFTTKCVYRCLKVDMWEVHAYVVNKGYCYRGKFLVRKNSVHLKKNVTLQYSHEASVLDLKIWLTAFCHIVVSNAWLFLHYRKDILL